MIYWDEWSFIWSTCLSFSPRVVTYNADGTKTDYSHFFSEYDMEYGLLDTYDATNIGTLVSYVAEADIYNYDGSLLMENYQLLIFDVDWVGCVDVYDFYNDPGWVVVTDNLSTVLEYDVIDFLAIEQAIDVWSF